MINPNKPLFRWGPLEYKVFYGSFFNEALWVQIPKVYEWPWPPTYGVIDRGKCTFILEEDLLRGVGENYFKTYFLNKVNFRFQWKTWEKWVKEYEDLSRVFDRVDWKSLSTNDLYQTFKTFYAFNIRFWVIVHVPEVANWGGERMLLNELTRIDPAKAKEYLEILATPVKQSFFQKEELDLLLIGLVKDPKKKELALERHAKKYCWILNSYGGNRVLTKEYFQKELDRLLTKGASKILIQDHYKKIKLNQQRQNILAKKLKLSKKVLAIAQNLQESIWWQDLRKGYIWRMNYYWDIMLRQVEGRTSWKFDDLVQCYPEEVLKIIKGQRVDSVKIHKRSGQFVSALKAGGRKEIYNNAAKKIIARFTPKMSKEHKDFLRGLVVSRGTGKTVIGEAKIVYNPFKEGEKMKQGDILIAPMTSPEFIVVMRRAAAIITDQGGMTSHAAIVSRELNIPCIVGTKFATSMYKDGDKVEVDVSRGMVTKIK